MSDTRGMGGHQSAKPDKTDWLTPPYIINALGQFDLDPCSSDDQPWDTARHHYTIEDDGLGQRWSGRVWLNPPYGRETKPWLKRLRDHGEGTALIFARTETAMFFSEVWAGAKALLFLEGRLFFYHPNGMEAGNNSGAPSVLIAYGASDADKLRYCGLPGAFTDKWEINRTDQIPPR